MDGSAISAIERAMRDGAHLAVFVVHEFRNASTKEGNLERNEKVLKKSMHVVLDLPEDAPIQGHLHGPVSIEGIDILVGKVVSGS